MCFGLFQWLIPCSCWGLVGREYHTQRRGLLLTPHVAATIPADREAEMKLPRKPVITAAKQLGAILPSRGRATLAGWEPSPSSLRGAEPAGKAPEAAPGV